MILFLSDALILAVLQFQTQQVMTPEIRSYIEYLTYTYYYSHAHYVVENDKKYSLNGFF